MLKPVHHTQFDKHALHARPRRLCCAVLTALTSLSLAQTSAAEESLGAQNFVQPARYAVMLAQTSENAPSLPEAVRALAQEGRLRIVQTEEALAESLDAAYWVVAESGNISLITNTPPALPTLHIVVGGASAPALTLTMDVDLTDGASHWWRTPARIGALTVVGDAQSHDTPSVTLDGEYIRFGALKLEQAQLRTEPYVRLQATNLVLGDNARMSGSSQVEDIMVLHTQSGVNVQTALCGYDPNEKNGITRAFIRGNAQFSSLRFNHITVASENLTPISVTVSPSDESVAPDALRAQKLTLKNANLTLNARLSSYSEDMVLELENSHLHSYPGLLDKVTLRGASSLELSVNGNSGSNISSIDRLDIDAASRIRLEAGTQQTPNKLRLVSLTTLKPEQLSLAANTALMGDIIFTSGSAHYDGNYEGYYIAMEAESHLHFSALSLLEASPAHIHGALTLGQLTLARQSLEVSGQLEARRTSIGYGSDIRSSTAQPIKLGDVYFESYIGSLRLSGGKFVAHTLYASNGSAIDMHGSASLNAEELTYVQPNPAEVAQIRVWDNIADEPLPISLRTQSQPFQLALERSRVRATSTLLESEIGSHITELALNNGSFLSASTKLTPERVVVGEHSTLNWQGEQLDATSVEMRNFSTLITPFSAWQLGAARQPRWTGANTRLVVSDNPERDAQWAKEFAIGLEGPSEVVFADEIDLRLSMLGSGMTRGIGTFGSLDTEQQTQLTLGAAGLSDFSHALGFADTNAETITVGNGLVLSIYGRQSEGDLLRGGGQINLIEGASLRLGLAGLTATRQGTLGALSVDNGHLIVEAGDFHIDRFSVRSELETVRTTYTSAVLSRSGLKTLTLLPRAKLTLEMAAPQAQEASPLAEETILGPGSSLTVHYDSLQQSAQQLYLHKITLGDGATFRLDGNPNGTTISVMNLVVGENAEADLRGFEMFKPRIERRPPPDQSTPYATVRAENRGILRLKKGVFEQFEQRAPSAESHFETLLARDMHISGGKLFADSFLPISEEPSGRLTLDYGTEAHIGVMGPNTSLSNSGVADIATFQEVNEVKNSNVLHTEELDAQRLVNTGLISGIRQIRLSGYDSLNNTGTMVFEDGVTLDVGGIESVGRLENLSKLIVRNPTYWKMSAADVLAVRDSITLHADGSLSFDGVQGEVRAPTIAFRFNDELNMRPGIWQMGHWVSERLTTNRNDLGLYVVVGGELELEEDSLSEASSVYTVMGGLLRLGETSFYQIEKDGLGSSTLVLGKRLRLGEASQLIVADNSERISNVLDDTTPLRFAENTLTVVDGALLAEDETPLISAIRMLSAPNTHERVLRAAASDAPIVHVAPGARLLVKSLPQTHGRLVLIDGFKPSEGMVESGHWVGGWSGEDALSMTSTAGLPLILNTYWEQPADSETGRFVVDMEGENFERIDEVYPNIVIPKNFRTALEQEGEGGVDADFLNAIGRDPALSISDKEKLINSAAQLLTLLGLRTQVLAAGTRLSERIDARLSLPEHSSGLWVTTEAGQYGAHSIPAAGAMSGGYRERSGGVTMGADRSFGTGYAGVALSAIDSSVHSRGDGLSASGNTRMMALQLYAAVRASDDVRLLASAGLFSTRAELTMPLSMGWQSASADLNMRGYWLNARAEKDFSVDSLRVTPHTGARWVEIGETKFATKIRGEEAWINRKASTHTWQFPIGVSFTGNYALRNGWKIQPTFDFTVTPQVGDRSTSTHVVGRTLKAHDRIQSSFAPRLTADTTFSIAAELDAWRLIGAYRWGFGSYGRNEHRLMFDVSRRF